MRETPALMLRADAPKRLSRVADDIRTLSLQLKLADTDICPRDGSDWAKSLESSIQRCRSSADDIMQAVLRLTAKSVRSVESLAEDIWASALMPCQIQEAWSDHRCVQRGRATRSLR